MDAIDNGKYWTPFGLLHTTQKEDGSHIIEVIALPGQDPILVKQSEDWAVKQASEWLVKQVGIWSVSQSGEFKVKPDGNFTVQPGNIANTTPWLVSVANTTPISVSVVNSVADFTHSKVAAAGTNPTVVKNSAGSVVNISVMNTTVTGKYLRFYNKSTVPTPGTDQPILVVSIPAGLSKEISFAGGLGFGSGISYSVTGGVALLDSTPVVANDVILSIGFK